MMGRKWVGSWAVWIVTDVLLVGLYASQGLLPDRGALRAVHRAVRAGRAALATRADRAGRAARRRWPSDDARPRDRQVLPAARRAPRARASGPRPVRPGDRAGAGLLAGEPPARAARVVAARGAARCARRRRRSTTTPSTTPARTPGTRTRRRDPRAPRRAGRRGLHLRRLRRRAGAPVGRDLGAGRPGPSRNARSRAAPCAPTRALLVGAAGRGPRLVRAPGRGARRGVDRAPRRWPRP